jgi:hypothetical protein
MRRGATLALAAFLLPACVGDSTRMLGEIDRVKWTFRPCGSSEVYPLIFTSNEFVRFAEAEKEAGIERDEPTLIEFTATPVRSPWIWGRPTLGVHQPWSLEKGRCSEKAASP